MKKKILTIDDNVAIVETLELFLRLQGFVVKGAYSGHDGLALARDFIPDMILLDVVMPGMTGHEVCTSLKQDNRLKKIPVVFVTVEGKPEDISLGYSLGAEDYVLKPFDLTDLHKRITFILENNNGHKRKDSLLW
ncbi:MAG: response regulator [bacterium]|nr:response regulator [bacterium]